MAHKTLVGGTEYNITGGKALKDGTGYNVTGGTTLVGGSAYIIKFNNYDPVFSKNSWGQIIDACEKNKVPDTWTVGNMKATTINGGVYFIDIIGKNHDIYASGGKAPLTFQLHKTFSLTNSFAMHNSNTSNCGWKDSYMRNSTMSTMLSKMEDDIKAGIKKVKKYTATSGANSSSVITEDSLFLLSEAEVFGTYGTYSHFAEGGLYEYYTVSGRANKQPGPEESASTTNANWWLRSPCPNSSYMFAYVYAGSVMGGPANATKTIAPAFCF